MSPRQGTQTSPSDLAAERALPHDLEAERSVLAAILLDESVCNTATELLKPEDFFRDSHRLIFERMTELSGTGQPIDPTTLANALSRRNQLELVGGVTFLSSLIDTYALPSNLEAYARIIKDGAMLRRAIQVCQDGMAACFEQGDDAETLIDNLEKAIFEVGEARIRSGFVAVADVAREQLAQVEDAQNRPDALTGLWTGFTDLDRMTNGLQPSDLIIVAARPSMGKTAFCLNIAQNVAVAGGKTVGVYSLEMSKESLVLRMLCAEGMVDSQRMRGGFLGKDEWAKLAEALQALTSAKIFIDDTPGITVMEMRAKARRLKAQHGLDLLIVDYLQLIRGKGKIESRQTEVSQISRDLKGLAKELGVPLIALSQLSRASEGRSDHRPMLSDLRESGSIEQDADVVAFIFREEMYDQTDENEGKAELIISKQRNGPTGTIELSFMKHCTRFNNAWRDGS
jgi:replicative DNA helicase